MRPPDDALVAAVGRLGITPYVLDTVCRASGMGFAAIARVTDTRWTACATRDDIALGIGPGDEMELRATICDEVRARRRPICIPDIARDPTYRDHRVVARYGLRSYVGQPILLPGGEVFGTLCAIDVRPMELDPPEVLDTFRLFAEMVGQHLKTVSEVERLNALFEHAPSFMALQRGPRHVYELANSAYYERIGRRDIIGLTVAEALPDAEAQGFGAILDEVYRTGRPYTQKGARYVPELEPGQPLAEQFLDFTYQPYVEDGQVTGIFTVGYDATDRVLQNRRVSALADLGERLRQATDADAMASAAAAIMAEVLDAPRAGIGTVDQDAGTVFMHPNWLAPGIDPVEGLFRFEDYGSYLGELERGETVILADVDSDPRSAAGIEAMHALGIRTLVNIPIVEQTRLKLLAFVHFAKVRPFSAEDVAFVQQVADRTQAAMGRLVAEQQQLLLNGELSHRIKNTLGVVQAIAYSTLGGIADQAAVRAFNDRIIALAAAHDVLLRQSWSAAPLGDVARSVLAAFGADRFQVSGPEVTIGPRAALALSLMLHELATNAVKYGALSVPAGTVVLDWTVRPAGEDGGGEDGEGGGGGTLVLGWTERGGPPAAEPTRQGFGSRIIRMGLIGSGGVDVRYTPQGLALSAAAPLYQVQEA